LQRGNQQAGITIAKREKVVRVFNVIKYTLKKLEERINIGPFWKEMVNAGSNRALNAE